MQRDREQADISGILQELQEIVDDAIDIKTDRVSEAPAPYDISKINFERLRAEFERSTTKNTTVQNLRQAIEVRVHRLLQENPPRTNFHEHYEKIVEQYNAEKDRATIEQTFEALMRLSEELSEEDQRALREGLTEESLAIYDLLFRRMCHPHSVAGREGSQYAQCRSLALLPSPVQEWTAQAAHTTGKCAKCDLAPQPLRSCLIRSRFPESSIRVESRRCRVSSRLAPITHLAV